MHSLGKMAEYIVLLNVPRIAKHYFGGDDLEDILVRRQIRNKIEVSAATVEAVNDWQALQEETMELLNFQAM